MRARSPWHYELRKKAPYIHSRVIHLSFETSCGLHLLFSFVRYTRCDGFLNVPCNFLYLSSPTYIRTAPVIEAKSYERKERERGMCERRRPAWVRLPPFPLPSFFLSFAPLDVTEFCTLQQPTEERAARRRRTELSREKFMDFQSGAATDGRTEALQEFGLRVHPSSSPSRVARFHLRPRKQA